MNLYLPPTLLDQILTHCHHEHPLEACGLLAGRHDLPARHVPMRNTADQPATRFEFDLDQQLQVWQDMDEAGEDPIVIYHSHTASEPIPSGTDRAHFTDPDVHYVIVSTHDTPPPWPRLRSWRYVDGAMVEEPIVIAATCG